MQRVFNIGRSAGARTAFAAAKSVATQVGRRHFSKLPGSREPIPACPQKVKFGATGLIILSAPCIYVGGQISAKAAGLLEDYDIFVPEDDDDDD